MDVTLREGVYCDFGLDYDKAIDYISMFEKYVDPQDVEYLEFVYINTDEHSLLSYNEEYINKTYELCKNKFKLVGMMHPGRADMSLWNPDVIKKLDLVRIVCNGSVIPDSVKDYIDYLHKYEIKVSINIAYVLSKDEKTIIDMYRKCQDLHTDYVYFADSSGSACIEDIDSLCAILQEYKKDNYIGFHLHDHLGMASANALRLYHNKVDISDASITGAGKGAGNLKTESIVPLIRQIEGREMTAEMLKNYVLFIQFFNKLVNRENDYHLEVFKNSMTGLFKIRLKDEEEFDRKSKGDIIKYIDLIMDSFNK